MSLLFALAPLVAQGDTRPPVAPRVHTRPRATAVAAGPAPTAPRSTPSAASVAAAIAQADGAEATACVARTTFDGRRYATLHLGECPAPVLTTAAQWDPDVLVALGGGILPSSHPGCSTMQRGYATYRLFERLGRRPALLLSGRGPRRPVRPLDEVEVRCALARRAQDLASSPPGARPVRLRAEAEGIRASRRGSLNEAEHLCAVILRRYPAAEQPAVLGRMLFESRSLTTSQNVAFSTPILRRRHFRRVLVVSTNAFPTRGVVDNHTRRAVSGFRAARRARGHYLVSGVTCPYWTGGECWSSFE